MRARSWGHRAVRAGAVPGLAALLMLLCPFWVLAAPTTPPGRSAPATQPAVVGQYDQLPIRARSGRASERAPTTQSALGRIGGADQLVIGLAVVLGLIGAGWWLVRQGLRQRPGGKPGQPVRVIHRVPLSSRQSLAVVQFGRRLVLVASGASQASPIAEVSDPEEVAQLLSQLGATEGQRGGFPTLLSASEKQFQRELETSPAPHPGDEIAREADVHPDDARQELGELAAKIKALSRQFRAG